MGKSLTQKILSAHLVEGTYAPGNEIGIRIDQTLTQDATGTMVYLQFESMELPRVKTELSVSYVDHNTLQSDYRNMDDHRYLQSVARKYGIHFSRPGNGICHQVHLERFGAPGKTLLGSDSHTPTGGGLGMIAIGAGGLDIAVALAAGPFYLTVPRVTGVQLTGQLAPMCSAKDIILTILKKETVKGGVGCVYEYFGDGVKTLTVPQRATITNMGAELGATTSVFPSDEVTRAFLELQGRPEVYAPFSADADAHYDRIIEINLDEIVPMAACPHSPDAVKTVAELSSIVVDQVAIGSCTNSSINDLGIASDILQGKTVAEGVSLGVSPGSKQVFISAMKAGIIQNLTESGARILESACGPCIGMGFAPKSGGVSVRTFNRNFEGRSGTRDAQVYLVSPETAAATALTGKLTDPRNIKPSIINDYSSHITINDNLIVKPAAEDEATSLVVERGPNIAPCPKAPAVDENLSLRILLNLGDNITTDHIMPAGAKILPLRSNIPEISKYTFESVDPEFYKRAKEAGKGMIIAGENYGQGSSREHAALAPMYLGIRIVAVKSFARIHRSNLINYGIIPLVFADANDADALKRDEVLEFRNIRDMIENDSTVTAISSSGRTVRFDFTASERERQLILTGGLLNYTRKQAGK